MRVHVTENRSVGGSIPPLGTIELSIAASIAPRREKSALRTAIVGSGKGPSSTQPRAA
jgi:hypothetical protein